MTWQPIETAPRDGKVFIARNVDHPSWGSWPMMRHVRWVFPVDAEEWECRDMGAWIHILDNAPDPDGHESPHRPDVPFSYASDEYNTTVRYEWMPLPEPPA